MKGQNLQQDRRWAILVFAASTLCLAPGVLWGLPTGKAVEGGLRILDGQVPYRDFWSMYAPGQFYAQAGLFWIFGREILVQAVGAVLVRAASAAVFYVLLRRVGSTRRLSLFLVLISVVMWWTTAPELTSYPPTVLLVLLALDRVTSYLLGDGAPRLYSAGVWIGLAALFKHDVAAYVAVGIGTGLVLSWVYARDERPEFWITPTAALFRFGAAVLAVLVPGIALLAWAAGPDAWQDLIVFPATTFSQVRNNDFPSLLPPLRVVVAWLRDLKNLQIGSSSGYQVFDWILCNLPLYVFVGGVWALAVRPRLLDAKRASAAILWLSCMPLFWAAAHVQTNTHVYSMATLSFLLWAMAWQASGVSDLWQHRVRPVLGTLIVVFAAGVAIPPAMNVVTILVEWSESRVLEMPGVRGVRVSAREYAYYEPIARFFRTNTREDERIYSGLLRHDAIVINKPNFYAVTRRASCCRFSELHPGIADRAAVQREIIADLERHDVRGIILWEFGWSDAVLDEFKARSIAALDDGGATLLDEYISERFEPIAQYDEYVVMWRSDAPSPVEPSPGGPR